MGHGQHERRQRGLIEHWDGEHWKVYRDVGSGDGDNVFVGGTSWGSRYVAVVGGVAFQDDLALHYDGTPWTLQ